MQSKLNGSITRLAESFTEVIQEVMDISHEKMRNEWKGDLQSIKSELREEMKDFRKEWKSDLKDFKGHINSRIDKLAKQ